MAAMARARKQKAAAAAAAKKKATPRPPQPKTMGGVVDIAMANKDLLRKKLAAKPPARKPDKWDAHLKASKL